MLPAPSSPLPTGRPRALDETKLREVCALISAGCGIIGAARYVGCAPSTIRREARRNVEFNEKLRRSYLAAELGPLNAMQQAAKKYWRAAAWLLERADAQRFGKQNVRLLKPEQLEEFTDTLADILNAELNDEEACRRVTRRFDQVIKQTERNLAAELNPCPPHRPQKRRRRRLPDSIPTVPGATPQNADENISQNNPTPTPLPTSDTEPIPEIPAQQQT